MDLDLNLVVEGTLDLKNPTARLSEEAAAGPLSFRQLTSEIVAPPLPISRAI